MYYPGTLFILAFLSWSGNCIVILDRGNPRFMRGALVDMSEPQVNSGSGVNVGSEDNLGDFFGTQEQVHSKAVDLMQDIVQSLESYNEAVTAAMIIAAKDIKLSSSVTLCQLARTRMSALKIVEIFQTLEVDTAITRMHETSTSSNILREKMRTVFSDVSKDFSLMEQDLQNYDGVSLGNTSMIHFGRAIRDFSDLQLTVSDMRGAFAPITTLMT